MFDSKSIYWSNISKDSNNQNYLHVPSVVRSKKKDSKRIVRTIRKTQLHHHASLRPTSRFLKVVI